MFNWSDDNDKGKGRRKGLPDDNFTKKMRGQRETLYLRQQELRNKLEMLRSERPHVPVERMAKLGRHIRITEQELEMVDRDLRELSEELGLSLRDLLEI